MSAAAVTSIQGRTPVYFLGIGGPNFMENTKHPAYTRLADIGREITAKVKPRAVVVISAHWQGSPSSVQVNVAEQTDLIYDFYGFPKHFYDYYYPNKGSPEIAGKVIEHLSVAGIEVEKVERGLDHGVWVGFLAAFNPKENPLSVPIVQVSLYGNEDANQHYRLGKALQGLRYENILIIGAGMSVHNLRDFRAMKGRGEIMPYAASFDDALKLAVAAEPAQRQKQMADLLLQNDARKAHPSLEHLLPMYVCAGAAGEDPGDRLWTFPEGSLNWAQYRFGAV